MKKTLYPSLILITNSHHAKWYVAHEKGVPELARERFQPKERPMDREGFFQRSAKGKVVKSGAPEKADREWLHEQELHLSAVRNITKTLWHSSYGYLAVFAPDRMKSAVAKKIAGAFPTARHAFLAGNFLQETPKEIQRLFRKILLPH